MDRSQGRCRIAEVWLAAVATKGAEHVRHAPLIGTLVAPPLLVFVLHVVGVGVFMLLKLVLRFFHLREERRHIHPELVSEEFEILRQSIELFARAAVAEFVSKDRLAIGVERSARGR